MRRILCLYLPQWPIQRLLAAREIQKSEFRIQNSENATVHSAFCILHSAFPVLLHARDPRRGELIVACNAVAHQRGMRLNMPLAEAAALAGRGGECLIVPQDPAADLAALARLAEHCERFSPLVGWKTDFGPPTGPDCLFLDVTGIGVLFGGEEHLAGTVIGDVARFGYETRVAVADTIGAAWAWAKQAGSSELQVLGTQYPLLSTELFESQPIPDSRSPIPDLRLRTPHFALGTLPVESLRLPSETVDLLAQLGIVRLEQLWALPRESLRARFGERLLLRIDQLLGTAQEMIVPYRPPPQFADEWPLEYPAEKRDTIEQIVHELVHRVAAALADRREGVLKLLCRLDCAPGRPVFLDVGLFRPSADEKHLRDLLRMQLEQAALPGPVGRVRLEAALTAPLENRQGKLFAGGQDEAERQLALFIDRCSSRLGPEAVLCPELTADPLPERAVRWRPGVGSRGSGDKKFKVQSSRFKVGRRQSKTLNLEPGTLNSDPHSALLRPLVLHSPSLEIAAVAIAPDGPPRSFRLQGQQHQVVHQWGPERIETGWWRGRSVRRDYWRVETSTGQRFWLFRCLNDGQWRLHGEYQ